LKWVLFVWREHVGVVYYTILVPADSEVTVSFLSSVKQTCNPQEFLKVKKLSWTVREA